MKRIMSIRIAVIMVVMAMVAGTFTGIALPMTASQSQAATNITSSKAKRIAMRNAGVGSSSVEGMDVDKTYKDGKNVYMVYFYAHKSGRTYNHYAYTISARTGSIIKKNAKTYTVITKKSARNKALDDADLDRDDVTDMSVDLDEDDGKLVYEVSFTEKVSKRKYYYYDGTYYYDEDDDGSEYEYTINAVTGHIIDSDSDDDDD